MSASLQINSISLVVLVIVFISLALSKDYHVRESRSFRAMLGLTAVLLITEMLIAIAAEFTTDFARIVHISANVASFIALPSVAISWVFYTFREIGFYDHDKRWVGYLTSGPLIVTGIIALITPFTGLYFTIDAANIYHRGPLFLMHATISLIYLVAGFLVTLANRSKFAKREFIPMLLFVVPPLVGSALQMAFYGLLLINPTIVLSLLMIFILNQSRRVVTDYLTGLNNRRQFDSYVKSIKVKSAAGRLAGMFIDLDEFKYINDTHGHLLGDEVLMAMAEILTDTFLPSDFIARTGGDEFFVFFEIDAERTIASIVKRFIARINESNDSGRFPFAIKLSYGIALFDAATHGTIARFVASVDQIMYRQKRRHRQPQAADKTV